MLSKTSRPSAPFVGRELEMCSLKAALLRAGEGIGTLALVAGEPGWGKTRLAQEFAAHARAKGWEILFGQGYELEGMGPYAPFIEPLRKYVRDMPLDELRSQLGEDASDVALLVPEMLTLLPDVSPVSPVRSEHQRYRLLAAVADFIVSIARASTTGLVIILDDLHWANKPSLLLLSYLARKLASAPLLVLGTYRTVWVEATHPFSDLLSELSTEHLYEHLSLPPLSRAESAALIGELAGALPTSQWVDAIYRESTGSPLVIEELVRGLQAEGHNLSHPSEIPSTWATPCSLRQVIVKRLSRLSVETNRMLQAAAVLGHGCTFELLQRVSRMKTTPLVSAMETAIRHSIILDRNDDHRFAHPLVQQAVYDGLTVRRRQKLHFEAAKAIESVDAEHLVGKVERVAAHYRLAGPLVDPQKALEATIKAAEAALAVSAFEEAAAQFRRAVALIETKQHREKAEETTNCRLLLALADAERNAGDPETAHASYARAAEVARHEASGEYLGRAALGFVGRGLWLTAVPGSIELLEEALGRLNDDHAELRARLACSLAELLWTVHQDERARSIKHQALSLARESGSTAALASVIRMEARLGNWPEAAGRVLSLCDKVLRDVKGKVLESEATINVCVTRMIALLTLGEMALADAQVDELKTLRRNARVPGLDWCVLNYQATSAAMEGRLEEAKALALKAREAARRNSVEAILCYYVGLMVFNALDQRLEREIEAYLHGPARSWRYDRLFRTVMASVYLRGGHLDRLRQEYDILVSEYYSTMSDSRLQPCELALLAEVCATLGDTKRATELYETLLPMRASNLVSYLPLCVFGSAARYLGLLATALNRYEEAFEHFEFALERNRIFRAKLFVVLTERDYARALLARGQPGDALKAKALLSQALAEATAMGMTLFAKECAGLLSTADRRRKVRSATIRPSQFDTLTSRELDVLRLLAEGESDRQIALALCLSVNTVHRHIAEIYSKTGLRNRSQATRFALEKGLIPGSSANSMIAG